MKRKLERFMGSGPLEGTAARFTLALHGGVEVVIIGGDKDALQLYVQALGLDPLPADSMEEVLLVEKSAMKSMELINAETGEKAGMPVPGSGMTH